MEEIGIFDFLTFHSNYQLEKKRWITRGNKTAKGFLQAIEHWTNQKRSVDFLTFWRYVTMSTKVLLRSTSLFVGSVFTDGRSGGGGFSKDGISLRERRICTNGWVVHFSVAGVCRGYVTLPVPTLPISTLCFICIMFNNWFRFIVIQHVSLEAVWEEKVVSLVKSLRTF